jgi:hypothetical protein
VAAGVAVAVLREAADRVDQKVVVVRADQKADADRVVQSSVEVPGDLKVVVVLECVDLKVSLAAAGQ